MKIWKPEEGDEGFDLTPMIDIVFLLIVFFMTVANILTTEKRPVELPVAEDAEIPEEYGLRTTLTVAAEGEFYSGRTLVSKAELGELLAEVQAENPRVKLYIRGDGRAEHRFINTVMQACAQAGIYDVSFAAYQTEK